MLLHGHAVRKTIPPNRVLKKTTREAVAHRRESTHTPEVGHAPG